MLPFGKDQKFMHDAGGLANAVVGGWSVNWILTLQGGQPITLSCPTETTAGTSCYDVDVPGQSQKLGIRQVDVGGGKKRPDWFGNLVAFQQPCQLIDNGAGQFVPDPGTPSGCIPLSGRAILGGYNTTTSGPGFHRLDFSAFKAFQLSERFWAQFRAEFFNIVNHPNFNAPTSAATALWLSRTRVNFNNSNFGYILFYPRRSLLSAADSICSEVGPSKR